MDKFSDPRSLRAGEYNTPKRLNARIAFHQDFSSNPIPFQQWVFDRVLDLGAARIVEIGCGPADLWAENAARIPADWQVTLMDLSPGMLRSAHDKLKGVSQLHFVVGDAMRIPAAGGRFQAAIANHMLYHVPDIPGALAQLRDMLAPGGQLLAATNGERHLVEVWQWAAEALPRRTDILASRQHMLRFSLQNGAAILKTKFSQVTLERYDDELICDQAQPVVDFADASMQLMLNEEELAIYKEFLEKKLQREGRLRIQKEVGVFTAS